MDKVQKIKEEIERRIEMYKGLKPVGDQFYLGQISVAKGILQFIDSLPEEPNMKNEDSLNECPCCGWALDSDGCCGSCGYGRK